MFTPARKTIVGLAIAASFALGVTSAQAANIVPNPGFETTTPFQWSALPGASILQYPVGPHTGSWDMRMISAGTDFIMTSDSVCVPVTGGATYNLSFWYRVAAGQLVTFVGFWTHLLFGCRLHDFPGLARRRVDGLGVRRRALAPAHRPGNRRSHCAVRAHADQFHVHRPVSGGGRGRLR